MDSIENIRTIIAGFLNCTADKVNDQTRIDRESLRGSIMVNRMFAVLKSEGLDIEDYSIIKTFGELVSYAGKIGGKMNKGNLVVTKSRSLPEEAHSCIGIDIERVNKLPDALDYREEPFYKQNFSPHEIAFCILKTDSKESFAGLFAAKEALVKADQNLRSMQFSDIEIVHDSNGKPNFGDFSISISHTENIAVAVVVRMDDSFEKKQPNSELVSVNHDLPLKFKLLIYITFIISITSLIMMIYTRWF